MEEEELDLLNEARLQLEASDNQQLKLQEDILICECMCISVEDIRDIFNEHGKSLAVLQEKLGLGSACSTCIKSKDAWLDLI